MTSKFTPEQSPEVPAPFTFEKVGRETHILIPSGQEEAVLKAIARASFDLAEARGMGIMQYDAGQVLSEDLLNRIVHKEGELALQMSYVSGRVCQTEIHRGAVPGQFIVDDFRFERDRGPIEPVLRRAQELLRGVVPSKVESPIQVDDKTLATLMRTHMDVFLVVQGDYGKNHPDQNFMDQYEGTKIQFLVTLRELGLLRI